MAQYLQRDLPTVCQPIEGGWYYIWQLVLSAYAVTLVLRYEMSAYEVCKLMHSGAISCYPMRLKRNLKLHLCSGQARTTRSGMKIPCGRHLRAAGGTPEGPPMLAA